MGQIAATADLNVQAGATWTERITYRDSTTGLPIDLTGYSARMQLRERVDATVVDLEITTANGRLAVTPAGGQIDLLVAAADSAALAVNNVATKYAYGLEIYKPAAGEDPELVTSLLTGVVTVYPEVVRS